MTTEWKYPGPFLLDCIEQEIFTWVDLYFAETFLGKDKEQESTRVFLCYLLLIARYGHLCLEVSEEIIPSPFCFMPKFLASWVEQNIIEAKDKIPPFLLSHHPGPLKLLCEYQSCYYLQKHWILETTFLEHLHRLCHSKLSLQVQKQISLSPQLNEWQAQAIDRALSSPVSVITGGPGSGKTFTATHLIRAFWESLSEKERDCCHILVAAPTGKAASHLSKNIQDKIGPSVKVTCGTLHSLLQIRSSRQFYEKGASLFADLLILDECSMIDARLFSFLLSCLQGGGRLVLMGDKNQLPAVDPGCFFADILESSDLLQIPCTHLKQSIRIEQPKIAAVAESIYRGIWDETLFSQEDLDCRFVQIDSIQQARLEICQKCMEVFPLPQKGSMDLASIFEQMEPFRILSCLRKGLLGVEEINRMVLKSLLQGAEPGAQLALPILITENDYDMDLYNGDTGILVADVESLRQGIVSQRDMAYFSSQGKGIRQIPALTLPAYDWGYCLSVHKSQGGEYDQVWVVVPSGSEVFGREILYTAVTRAKKKVAVFAAQEVLSSLLRKSSRKMSGIKKRIQLNCV